MSDELTKNLARNRYELHGDDGDLLGFVEYLPAGESTIIAHTEVAVEHEGEGVGGRLVRGTFAAIEADGKTVIPLCPFAAAYVRRHPDLVALVAPSMRSQF
ncbi:GNAT family N-acetyltransferase [Conexibacter sp. CPCC 206217]|uniref:GNAT family N-acetyltransferase n=1 Tax=Conexibacter sp. CPCC 206217 TaxID=3064574 RepID=UPI0027255EF5|nr:GNAT family N-acetyltransferase [Conexibacter sp. CPCC 206217]MDO8209512.1 GNAT family N-acetyltransferase [Conexibacter sp. CPCC 206217]